MLVDQLGEELQHRYGWKSEVARRLGVRPSYIAKILGDEIETVGQHVLDRAIAALRLAPGYFTDAAAPEDWRRSVKPKAPTDFLAAAQRTVLPTAAEWERMHHEAASLLRQVVDRQPIDPAEARRVAQLVMSISVVNAARTVLEAADGADLDLAARRLAVALLEQSAVAAHAEYKFRELHRENRPVSKAQGEALVKALESLLSRGYEDAPLDARKVPPTPEEWLDAEQAAGRIEASQAAEILDGLNSVPGDAAARSIWLAVLADKRSHEGESVVETARRLVAEGQISDDDVEFFARLGKPSVPAKDTKG